MKQVETNDTVTVTLIGTLDNGAVFETANESAPKIITIGATDTPKALQRQLKNMQIGEMRKIRLEPEEGEYGIRRSDLLHIIPRKQFTDKIDPKVGIVLSMNIERDGVSHQVPATIVELDDNNVTIDYNHPLAGHSLNYEITILDITKG